ncbi:MAG: hypothetical protein M3Z09_11995 [Acidobacteriota bacterium]|nr:hypothetical protein [Acidobacteriota bacterium]
MTERINSSVGINAHISALRKAGRTPLPEIRSVLSQSIAIELVERSNAAEYPSLLVYCEKLSNTLKEKFSVFSGTAQVCIEVRHSEDRFEALDAKTQEYSDLVCHLLDQVRGEWIEGFYYAGGYEVTYSPVRAGGKHFIQTAKVSFEVEISK